MNSTIGVQNQEGTHSTETRPALTNEEAQARFSAIGRAMAVLDGQIERCTDPLAEECLITLRVEHEIQYLKTLFRWEYEPVAIACLR